MFTINGMIVTNLQLFRLQERILFGGVVDGARRTIVPPPNDQDKSKDDHADSDHRDGAPKGDDSPVRINPIIRGRIQRIRLILDEDRQPF